jgi:hypothetical protein
MIVSKNAMGVWFPYMLASHSLADDLGVLVNEDLRLSARGIDGSLGCFKERLSNLLYSSK